MDNKNLDDGWDPTDYEIYTLEDEPADSAPSADKPQPEVKKDAVRKPPKPVKRKKMKSKKSKNTVLIFTVFAAVVVIAALLIVLKYYLPENHNEFEIFTNEGTKVSQTSENPNTVKITFPEGYTVYQYAELLEKNGVCSKADFYNAVNTPVAGIDLSQTEERVFLLEGYLFPDTYDFYKNEPAQSVVQRFIENYNSKVTPDMKAKAQALGYSMDEMLTLASIIQKECDYGIEECKNVSSVFHNRLSESRETYLGSDVTYFYLKNMADYLGGSDSQKFDDFLLKYYTYSGYRKGLPAGPVCNPGLKAIEAAVSPSETNYHYFLTDESGEKFYYAETFEQHQQNGRLAGLKGF